MTSHRFHPSALAEYEAAAVWYGPEGGRQFADLVDRSIDEICEAPRMWPVWRGEVRRRVLGRFPYAVLYVVDPTGVLIVAIAHHKRRPGYWSGRLRRR